MLIRAAVPCLLVLTIACGGAPTAEVVGANENRPEESPASEPPRQPSEDAAPTAIAPEATGPAEPRLVGIEEGTEVPPSPAHDADLYRGRLFHYLRSGWTLPPDLDASVASQLMVTCSVEFGANMEIVSFRFLQVSAYETFDRSVADHLRRLAAGSPPSPPPPSVASEFVGRTITVRFRGVDLR